MTIDYEKKDYATYLSLTLIASVIELGLAYITYRVIKITRRKNLLILSMLIFLNLDVMANLIIYALNTRDAEL